MRDVFVFYLALLISVPAWGHPLKLFERFCAFASLVKVASPRHPPFFFDPQLSREKNLQRLLEQVYAGAQVSLFKVGGLSFCFKVTHPDGRTFVALTPRNEGDVAAEMALERQSALFEKLAAIPGLEGHLPVLKSQFHYQGPSGRLIPVALLEMATHGDLHENLASFGPDIDEAKMLHYWQRIARPLQIVYQQFGLSHNDLKPQNIFLDRKDGRWNFWVGDWGHYHDPADPKPFLQGTPRYQSKESLGGDPTPRLDDVQGLKLTFLQMATGLPLHELIERYPGATETLNGVQVLTQLPPTELERDLPPSWVKVLRTPCRDVEDLYRIIRASLRALTLPDGGNRKLLESLKAGFP